MWRSHYTMHSLISLLLHCIIVIIITILVPKASPIPTARKKIDIIIFYVLGRYTRGVWEKNWKLTNRYNIQSAQSNAGKQSWSRTGLLLLLVVVVVAVVVVVVVVVVAAVVLELGLAVSDRNLQRNVAYVKEGKTKNWKIKWCLQYVTLFPVNLSGRSQ